MKNLHYDAIKEINKTKEPETIGSIIDVSQ